MIRGLIFDFDGLIIETEGAVFQSWQELFKAYGCEFSAETYSVLIGTAEAIFDPLELLAQKSAVPIDREQVESERLKRETELVNARPVLPGVRDYLECARSLGLKLAIASSSPHSWVYGHLTRLGLLKFFDAIKVGNEVPVTKPDPALYLAAIEALGIAPEEGIAFEDSPNGILAAKRAGLYCVTIPNALTRKLPLDLADLRLDSLADLPLGSLLEKVNHNHHSH